MILCITPNPALDRTVAVDGALLVGSVVRARGAHEAAGGKGINVTRVVRALGRRAVACGPFGGATGERVVALAAAEGIELHPTIVAGETRVCTVLATGDGDATVVNEPGPLLTDHEWRELIDDVASLAAGARVATISGSLPGGDADRRAECVVALADAAGHGGAAVWIDASGAALRQAMSVEGVALKVNLAEAGEVVGGTSAVTAARALLEASSASAVVVTSGADGAAWADRTGVGIAAAPVVEVVNATGSGDAFLAGLVVALDGGAPLATAVAHGAVVGAASAMSPHVEVDAATVTRLIEGGCDG
jgi:1-phosphofructokinase